MLIPNKHSGYRAGVRLYPGGGGGGPLTEAASSAAPAPPPPPPPPPWANLGVNTERGYNALMQTQAPGATPAMKGQAYNSLLSQGFDDSAIRSSADTLFGKQSGSDWNYLVQQGGMNSPTGRPLAGSAQFYQPVYQTQYTNYATTNPLGVSQYGQPMTAQSLVDSAYAGVGRYGMGNNPNQVDQAGRQYWMNELNTGALNPGNFFGAFNNAVQQDVSRGNQYMAAQPGYYGGFQNFSSPMPMYSPYSQQSFNPYMNTFQTPFAMSMPQRVSSGPSQAIVSRSAGARGAPAVMARAASGGITGLLK